MKERYVLSVYANSRGLGYVIFEAPLALHDWGIRRAYGKAANQKAAHMIEILIRGYKPYVLVLEDWTALSARRVGRVTALYQHLDVLARKHGVDVAYVSMDQVHKQFASQNAYTKHDIAVTIAARIPALSFSVPPERRVWMRQDPRQVLYDAAALGITFFQQLPST